MASTSADRGSDLLVDEVAVGVLDLLVVVEVTHVTGATGLGRGGSLRVGAALACG